MELELNSLRKFGRQRRAVALLSPFIRQLGEIVGLELYAVQLVISAEFCYFLFRGLLIKNHVTVFVPGKFVEQILGCNPLSVFLFGSEFSRNLENGIIGGWSMEYVSTLLSISRVLSRLSGMSEKSRSFPP